MYISSKPPLTRQSTLANPRSPIHAQEYYSAIITQSHEACSSTPAALPPCLCRFVSFGIVVCSVLELRPVALFSPNCPPPPNMNFMMTEEVHSECDPVALGTCTLDLRDADDGCIVQETVSFQAVGGYAAWTALSGYNWRQFKDQEFIDCYQESNCCQRWVDSVNYYAANSAPECFSEETLFCGNSQSNSGCNSNYLDQCISDAARYCTARFRDPYYDPSCFADAGCCTSYYALVMTPELLRDSSCTLYSQICEEAEEEEEEEEPEEEEEEEEPEEEEEEEEPEEEEEEEEPEEEPATGDCDPSDARNNQCCTDRGDCQVGDGDCDSDGECAGNLKCGTDNCPVGSQEDWDCCYDPAADCDPSDVNDNQCCTQRGNCQVGEGDCDYDDECAGNLKCGSDNCPVGSQKDWDCCYDPESGTATTILSADCSASAPDKIAGNDDCCQGDCVEGEGDCDEDSDCLGDLVCGTDNCPWGDGDDCCTG
eukprot:3221588-Rhodomonas_salina.1